MPMTSKAATPKAPERVLSYLAAKRIVARRSIALSVLCSALACACLIAAAWCLSLVVDAAIFPAERSRDLFLLLACFCGLYAVRAVSLFLSERAAFRAADSVKRAVRKDMYCGIGESGPLAMKREKSGSLLNSYIEGVEALHDYYMKTMPSRLSAVILPVMVFCAIAPFDVLSGLILLITAPLIPVFMIWIGLGAERLNQKQWRRLTYMGGRFHDLLRGMGTLNMFNAASREINAMRKVGEAFRRDTMAVLRIAFLSSLAMEFFATVSIALIAVLIGFRLFWGEMPFQEGFFLLLLAPEFYQPLRKMGADYHARMEAIGAAEEIVRFLPSARTTAQEHEEFSAERITIEFRNVFFAYEQGKNIIENASFVIEAGERVALTGISGSGKTTLMSLMAGFIQPASGEIFVNGTPLNRVDPVVWREHMAWMAQRPYIFPGTIADNIRMANPAATLEDIEAVLRHSNMSCDPQTVVGEGGTGLSGGQKQRLALARALIRKAPLVLLDEPTAHLDAACETAIQQTMFRVASGRTLIYAAHRSRIIGKADRVIHIEGGKISEREKVTA